MIPRTDPGAPKGGVPASGGFSRKVNAREEPNATPAAGIPSPGGGRAVQGVTECGCNVDILGGTKGQSRGWSGADRPGGGPGMGGAEEPALRRGWHQQTLRELTEGLPLRNCNC